MQQQKEHDRGCRDSNSTYDRTLLKMSNYNANGGNVSQESPIHIGNRRVITTL